jgi:diacylglycerol kinase family enzyme
VRGTHVSHPLVHYFPAIAMEIDGTPPQSVAVDGEVLGHTPVHIEVRPSCLPFLVGHA